METRTSAGGTAAVRRKELAAQAAKDLTRHRRTVGSLADGVDGARTRLLRDATALAAEQT
ncbi:hypothetical protein [Nonomuraea sp. NPDC049480]|uniref:hypothetical protein n=1 Tax=Nonomuraea sp. NPDC049480 TaxID=3364353 RepID=UPI00379BBE12